MPADPSPLTTTPSWGQVKFDWTSVSGATGYRVYRRRNSVGGDYFLIFDGTALTYTDIISAYDIDTIGTIAGEIWDYKITAYDSGSESAGLTTTVNMTAQTASDITGSTIHHTPYNDGSDQTASYTISNPDTLTATVSDATKLLHEGRMRFLDGYGRNQAN